MSWGRDAADVLVLRDLAQQVGQPRRICDVALGDLDCSELQRFFVDPEVGLAPNPSFGIAVLARVPLAFRPALFRSLAHVT